MNQAHLEDVRQLFTFAGQEELDAKQEAFAALDMSAQIFALGVLTVAALDAAYVIGETLDPSDKATPTAEPQPEPPAPELPPRRLALSSLTSSPAAPASEASTSSPAAPASEASTSSPAAPASEASTGSPAAPASAPFEVS